MFGHRGLKKTVGYWYCSQIHRYQHFGVACCFHLQDRRETENSSQLLVPMYRTAHCYFEKTTIPWKRKIWTLNLKRTNQMRSFALHNKKLLDLYLSPSFIRAVKCRKVSRNMDRMRETGNVYRSFVEKCRHVRSQRSWISNAEMGLCEIGCREGRLSLFVVSSWVSLLFVLSDTRWCMSFPKCMYFCLLRNCGTSCNRSWHNIAAFVVFMSCLKFHINLNVPFVQ
jgi:hypothetical protein